MYGEYYGEIHCEECGTPTTSWKRLNEKDLCKKCWKEEVKKSVRDYLVDLVLQDKENPKEIRDYAIDLLDATYDGEDIDELLDDYFHY